MDFPATLPNWVYAIPLCAMMTAIWSVMVFLGITLTCWAAKLSYYKIQDLKDDLQSSKRKYRK
jgi:hypothetical protein